MHFFGIHMEDRKTVFKILTGIFILGLLAGVRLYTKGDLNAVTGPLLLANHLYDLALVSGLFIICAGVGKSVLARLGFQFSRALEELVFSIPIGFGVISTSLLLAGFLTGVSAATFGLVFGLWLIFFQKEIRGIPSLMTLGFNDLKENCSYLSLAILGGVFLFMVSQALLPPLDWDSLMYHLEVPNQFLKAGRIFLPDDNFHTAFVQLIHMMYLALLAAGSVSGPALVSSFFLLGLSLAVYEFSVQFFDHKTANGSISLFWGTTLLILTAITPRVDVTLAYFLFLAHFALIIVLSDPSRPGFYFLSAVLLGFAFGVKYNAGLYGLALGPVICWAAYSCFSTLRSSVRNVFLFLLVVIATTLPWTMKNWWLFQAPFFPYFTQMRVEPWLTPLLNGQEVASLVGPIEIYSQMGPSFNLFDLITGPGRLNIEGEGRFYFLNPIFLLLPLWIFFLKTRICNLLLVPSILYGVLVYFMSPYVNSRYLSPAVVPLTLVTVFIFARLLARLSSKWTARAIFLAILLLSLFPSARMMYVWTLRTQSLGYLTGFHSGRENLFRRDPSHLNVTSFVNRHLSKENRVLMVGDSRAYYFEVPTIQDILISNWPRLSRKVEKGGCGILQTVGISHVLFNRGTLIYYIRRGLDPKKYLQLPSFFHFAKQCLTPIYRRYGQTVYQAKFR